MGDVRLLRALKVDGPVCRTAVTENGPKPGARDFQEPRPSIRVSAV